MDLLMRWETFSNNAHCLEQGSMAKRTPNIELLTSLLTSQSYSGKPVLDECIQATPHFHLRYDRLHIREMCAGLRAPLEIHFWILPECQECRTWRQSELKHEKTTNTWFKQETWHGNPPKTPSAESGAGWYFVTSPFVGLWRMLNTRWQYSHCSTSSTSHNNFHDFSNLSAYKLGSQPWPPCGRIWSKWSVALSH